MALKVCLVLVDFVVLGCIVIQDILTIEKKSALVSDNTDVIVDIMNTLMSFTGGF